MSLSQYTAAQGSRAWNGWRCRTAVALLGVLGPWAATARAETLLEFRFAVNDTLLQRITQEVTSTTVIQGQTVRSTMIQTMHVSQYVRDIGEDGTAAIQQIVDRVTSSMNMPAPVNRNFEYDSNSDSTNFNGDSSTRDYPELMGALVGARLRLERKTNGEIQSMEVPEQLVKKLQAIFRTTMAAGVPGEEGLRQLLAQPSLTLPATPVNPGDVWRSKTSATMPYGVFQIEQIYHYRGPDEVGLEQIDVEHRLTLMPNTEQPQPTRLISASSNGKILFDNELGQLETLNLVLDVELATTADPMNANQQVRQTVHQEVRVERE